MKPIKADLLILLVTIFWGSSYLFMKMGLNSISEFNLIALRFGLAFILAAFIFFRRLLQVNLETLKYAMLLGFLLFMVFTSITYGLKTTTTSNAGFLVSLTVVFVPLISAVVLKKKLETRLLFSIMLAIIGIGFLTIQLPFKVSIGDILCSAAAFFYAIHIIVTGFTAQKVDALNLGILQLGFAGLFGLIFSLIFETPTLPGSREGWFAILALAILCSALGFILQTVAQKYTSPSRTGLIFSLEPVFAAIFGYIFAQEIMSIKEYVGATLVLFSIILSTVKMKNNHLGDVKEGVIDEKYI
ncbi:DMT family transporter [Psychrobacillus vulpis]|uniref:DMT family transporter n=1 Tax=Psychrobacillus vulpis TaxID=2325572 RepID=A0A544TPN7_9BACI|nr:DMT family transporter [Psychrobacillus vulpis]TQR19420.1 DMT family transporter [Psychrobacillus vulpis]